MADKQAGSENKPSEDRADRTSKLLFGGLAVLFVLFAVVILLTDAIFLIPLVILAVVVFGYLGANRLLAKRIIRRDGSLEDALGDSDDGIPSAHLTGDSDTALGDTGEAHDEITPHDLPLFHPGRPEAVSQAGGVDGQVTTGNDDPSDTAPQSARPEANKASKASGKSTTSKPPRRPRAHQ